MALSGKEEIVIDILRESEMYGLEIIKKSNGYLRRGGIYTVLSRMEGRGLIEGRKATSDHPQGYPRRLYRVTENGFKIFLQRHSFLPKATLVSA